MSKHIENKIDEILDSEFTQERIMEQILFNPISKAFLKKYPAYYDMINTYDYGLAHIGDIVKTEKVLDENLNTGVKNVLINFKFHVENVRIYGPGTIEHKTHSVVSCSAQTPNEALKKKMTYCALLIGDIHYSYQIINGTKMTKSQVISVVIPDKYIVNIPIPIGSKYCILNQYDPLTLIRSGEEMEGAYGFFIIQGFIKHLNPYFQKPYNAPIILKNEYDNQLARMEGLYSAGLDYENSFHVIASILRPKQAHFGRGINQIPIVDFVFSLQMNDKCMNKKTAITRKKELINIVPIKYLFYAFDCSSDLEMLKYICPDLNDYGLIHTVRQACLHGKYHIECIKRYIGFSTNNGYLKLDQPLTSYEAKYLVGEIILSPEYKEHYRKTCKNDFEDYKREIIRQTKRLLRTKFMPGIGKINSDDSLYKKLETGIKLTPEETEKLNKQEINRNKAVCYELGLIVRKLYAIGNNIEPSMDRISLLNKRIRSGQQIENEYKSFHGARTREIKVEIERYLAGIKSESQLNNIEQEITERIKQLSESVSIKQSTSLINAFKGTVTKEKSKIRTIMTDFKNQSFLNAMVREIIISSDTKLRGTSVQWEHRSVHESHLYFIDPVYTPEGGQQVGRCQQPTIYTFLTTGSIGKRIYKLISEDPNFLSYADTIADKYIIKLNGSTIGYIKEYEPVENLYDKLIQSRRDGTIEFDASIVLKHKEGILDIWTDEGRIMTPFVDVKHCFETSNGKLNFNTDFLKWLEDCKNEKLPEDQIKIGLEKGFITLYDPAMAVYNANIAETVENFLDKPWLYNCIALPSHLLSYVTGISTAISMNAGVRGSYSSNHMKQGMGPILRYPQLKYINKTNILLAPHIPLTRTCIYDLAGFNNKPMGNNVIIAFLMYCDNQEDSFIVNRSSAENGLLVADSFTVLSNECKKQDETFQIPDSITQKIGNPESYMKLDPKSCLPKHVGDRFYNNDVIIAKVTQFNENSRKVDSSTLNEMPDGFHPKEANTRELRCVSKDIEIDNDTHYKMTVVGQRKCIISGDKFNSCNAQKGTAGRIYDSVKMPYTSSGIKPDIIFSPMSIFKRMTCGQLYEAYAAKLAALLGCPIDSTPYQTIRSMEELESIYKKFGFNSVGYEDLYDPESGRLMGKVFLGMMHYQRQQHLVEDKLNVRSIDGDFDKVSGLAVKGRKRKGGQSIDRMLVDSINSSGAVILNRDIHMNQGAKMTIAICGMCNKQYTYYSSQHKCWFCSCCGRHDNFIIKEVIPAEVLINQIFTGMHFTFEYRQSNNKPDMLKDIMN